MTILTATERYLLAAYAYFGRQISLELLYPCPTLYTGRVRIEHWSSVFPLQGCVPSHFAQSPFGWSHPDGPDSNSCSRLLGIQCSGICAFVSGF